jgi:hypothetical protein
MGANLALVTRWRQCETGQTHTLLFFGFPQPVETLPCLMDRMNGTIPRTNQLNRLLVRQSVGQWLPAFGLATVIFLGFFLLFLTLPDHQERDWRGRPLQTGTATVVGVHPPSRRNSSLPVVVLEVEGRRAVLRTALPLRSGQSIPVRYRIGRSGTVYLLPSPSDNSR